MASEDIEAPLARQPTPSCFFISLDRKVSWTKCAKIPIHAGSVEGMSLRVHAGAVQTLLISLGQAPAVSFARRDLVSK